MSTHTILPLMAFRSFSLFLLLFIDWVFVLDVKMPLAASLLFPSCADVNGCACDFFSMKGVYAQDSGSRPQPVHRAQARGNGKISTRVSSFDIHKKNINLNFYRGFSVC